MYCRINDIRRKEVINITDGSKIGYISDIEIDLQKGQLAAIIIYGRLKFWGLLGKEDDIVVPWKDVEVIGEETVLVYYSEDSGFKKRKTRSLFQAFKDWE
ncbi:MAG: YlmC/YmxH family sporulation protein [Oscillospiraceae bacterium]|jgi:YlmC/YmxH family sporulation protein|nr:YlmC/YmxH family sporulation protein [Oscillospiraceae bacterium]